MQTPHKPTKQEVQDAAGKTLADVIAPGLDVLFCGINPGLYTAAAGHHFARPGNRFWPVLHAAGFTDRQLLPVEQDELLKNGYGITNIVGHATARADELSRQELAEGAIQLEDKVRHYHPKAVAVLGITAYRHAFGRPKAVIGRQNERIGTAELWVLPNPSGLNAHYQLADLARLFQALRVAIHREGEPNG